MHKVSLIITVYNKEPFLRRCLDSIVDQTEKNAQIIIVDDGSTDGSYKICKEYCKKNGWELYNTKHQGVSEARNLGIDKATSEYIAFLDADDAYTSDALDIMTRISRHGYNIYQFGQYRYASDENSAYRGYCSPKGHYNLLRSPKYWQMIWNKLYKRSFINKNKIRFIKGMQFGEDEIFNARCILANEGLYHAPQTLVKHFLDDKKSLCRGELCLERLEGLDKELVKLYKRQRNGAKRAWLDKVINRHRNSALFKKYGFGERSKGNYDIVYFLKASPTNEELRYSLRSVEANWKYNKVWFYGGCPNGLRPDHHVYVSQLALSKWERVRDMIYAACKNDNITEDFWLFNDDFFVLKPKGEDMPPQYRKTLQDRIERYEKRRGHADDYTNRLRHLVKTLESAGKGTLDYAVHKPMLINRKKMLEVLDKYPNEPMVRALYGNYWEIGGKSRHDMKIQVLDYKKMDIVMLNWDFLSTSDESFRRGNVGRYIRDKFTQKSRFEL